MSAKNSRLSCQVSDNSSFTLNWKAVSAFIVLVSLLAAFVVVRPLWRAAHSPNDELDDRPPRHLATRPAPPVPIATIARRAELELARSVPTLGSITAPKPGARKGTVSIEITDGTNIDQLSDLEAVPERRGARETSPNSLRVFDDSATNRWFLAAYPTSNSLLEDLHSHSVELDLPSIKDIAEETCAKFVKGGEGGQLMVPTGAPTVVEIASRHEELAGLPFRRGAACRKSVDEAKLIDDSSKKLRRVIGVIESDGRQSIERLGMSMADETPLLRESRTAAALKGFMRSGKPGEDVHTAILSQVLQPLDVSVRLTLVNELAKIETAESSGAIADLAIYDLSPSVRKAACEALQNRPPREYRERLLAGLRYLWAPVTFHAAQAIVALDDRSAIAKLNELLNAPDPSVPVKNEKGEWTKAELVRINHLRNCYLCHAPSSDRKDLVRGFVPIPGDPLPRSYYQDLRGNFVRADITYLKQDFSITEPLTKKDPKDKTKEFAKPRNASPWPEAQRFDYVVRTRPATREEIAAAENSSWPNRAADYPQRLAVMFAIEGLMQRHGQSAGERRTLADEASPHAAAR